MAPTSLEDFMEGQRTSDEARDMLSQLWADAASKPYFLGANEGCIGRDCDITFRMRPVCLGSGNFKSVEIRPIDESDPNVDLEMILFGEIHAPPEEVPIGETNQTDFSVAKDSFIYDGLCHEIYGICEPQNASSAMSAAYLHQLEQIDGIMSILAEQIGKSKPAFMKPSSGRPDFQMVAPPCMKIGDRLEGQTVVNLGDPILVDDDPTRPRDEIYDLRQRRQCNWLGHRVLNGHATAIFKGRLKIWAARGPAMRWFFFADNIKVIAQDS